MYFVYNSKTREVVGLYNELDIPAWLNLNKYMMPISETTAVKNNLLMIRGGFFSDCWRGRTHRGYVPTNGEKSLVDFFVFRLSLLSPFAIFG